MKKTLLIFIFTITALFAAQKYASAQELYFCEGVSDNGNPQGESTTFNIPSGGGYFYFLVKLPYEIGCTSVNYDIYKYDNSGNAKFDVSIPQTGMQSSWTWFWNKVTFYKAGDYRVDVVDCNSSTLVSKYLTIKFK